MMTALTKRLIFFNTQVKLFLFLLIILWNVWSGRGSKAYADNAVKARGGVLGKL